MYKYTYLCSTKETIFSAKTNMTQEWILGIIGALFGGLNIFQLIYWRAERKKHNAEADSAGTDAKQKEIDLHQDQYDFLLQKLSDFQKDYYDLAEKLKQTTTNHINEITEVEKRFGLAINEKCNEISVLKSKLVYYKGLRCYDSNCQKRVLVNPKDNREKRIEEGDRG